MTMILCPLLPPLLRCPALPALAPRLRCTPRPGNGGHRFRDPRPQAQLLQPRPSLWLLISLLSLLAQRTLLPAACHGGRAACPLPVVQTSQRGMEESQAKVEEFRAAKGKRAGRQGGCPSLVFARCMLCVWAALPVAHSCT